MASRAIGEKSLKEGASWRPGGRRGAPVVRQRRRHPQLGVRKTGDSMISTTGKSPICGWFESARDEPRSRRGREAPGGEGITRLGRKSRKSDQRKASESASGKGATGP